MKISGVVITLDEERSLARAIHSMAFCDEIVVVDSGSTDRTVEIARELGARVVTREWTGYAEQKNFAASQASHDWILSLDADEEVSPALARSVRELQRASDRAAGYVFPRRARYLGRWIHHSGWYPDAKVRLYDRRRGRWVGDFVHESVTVDGPVARLDGDLLHYTCETFEQHIATVNRYTTLAARQMRRGGRRPGLLAILTAPPWTIFRTYVLRLGFLDGFAGVLIAVMAGFYVFSKYAKAREGTPG